MGLIKSGSGLELAVGIIIGGSFTLATMIFIEEGTSDVFSIWAWITVILVGIVLVILLFNSFTSLSKEKSKYDDNGVPDLTTRISPEKRKNEDW